MSLKGMKVLLVGSGYMAKEYLQVLASLDFKVTVIGRGKEKITILNEEFPQFDFHSGGLENYFKDDNDGFDFAINAVNVEYLKETSLLLINKKIRNILVEKPGGLNQKEIDELTIQSDQKNVNLFIAYNRRFYSSINILQEKIKEDGGIKSVHFEFTEWTHTIDANMYAPSVLEKFIIANSTHVIDTFFYLAGTPKILNNMVGGNEISWHPAGSIFIGSGITDRNIFFTYNSNWNAPGRWGIEVLTSKRKYYLKPLERLAIQEKGSVEIKAFDADYSVDIDFKPGLRLMLESFFNGGDLRLCTIKDHQRSFQFYENIGGYIE
ncbi:putative dehydrogenase [Pedobacter sp. UYP24]